MLHRVGSRRDLPSSTEGAVSLSPPLLGFFGLRLRVWIPSLRIASGRLTPCSLKYNPHALHTGSPSLLRRHRVVVRVPQFVQHKPKRLVAVCNPPYTQKSISIHYNTKLVFLTYQSFRGFNQRAVHTVHLVVEPAGIAQIVTSTVATPKGRRNGAAVYTLAPFTELKLHRTI